MADKPYWFPAKRIGWGWGPPATWQGWVVFGAYFALLALAGVRWLPRHDPISFVVVTLVLTIVLVGIAWLKGEPPRWRDGSGAD
jgi:hypothetical protein